jgi:DNA-cytosine methyltransferase
MQSNKGIVCLSLFDGISCGRVALDRAGIGVEKYYASEIDKYAIKISEKNYPDIIHIGDVRNINSDDYKNVDIIIGGSPCQCFSFAGKRNGMTTTENIRVTSLQQYLQLKQEHFQFEGQSYLFWEYVRILSAVHPKYFLLENVVMAQEWNDIISRALGTIYPEHTDQNEMFESARLEPIEINSALVSAQNRKRLYWTNIPNITQPEDKNIMLKDIIIGADADRDKSYCLDANYWQGVSYDYYLKKARRQLVKCGVPKISTDYQYWRKLTPIECERLQTLPDNYTEGISNTQRYKCIGNCWTVDVIAHIFSFIKENAAK